MVARAKGNSLKTGKQKGMALWVLRLKERQTIENLKSAQEIRGDLAVEIWPPSHKLGGEMGEASRDT